MTMLSKISLLLALAPVGACDLDDGTKNACNVQADCLAGYQCIDRTCVGGGNHNGPDAPGTYYGSVEPLTASSAGLAAANYETLAAVTTAPGPLGCAVAGDLQASPGADTAVVYAKVKAESGDTRCPAGVHAIVNDPNLCQQTFPDELREGCAIYKRWGANGQQAAYQLAIGGYVSVEATTIDDMTVRCVTDLSIRFAGGVTVAKAFQFDYNPLGPTSAFCVH